MLIVRRELGEWIEIRATGTRLGRFKVREIDGRGRAVLVLDARGIEFTKEPPGAAPGAEITHARLQRREDAGRGL